MRNYIEIIIGLQEVMSSMETMKGSLEEIGNTDTTTDHQEEVIGNTMNTTTDQQEKIIGNGYLSRHSNIM